MATTQKAAKKSPANKGVTLTKGETEILQRMKACVIDIGALEIKEQKTKDAHKVAKAALDEKRGALVDMVRAMNTPAPLIDRMEEDGWKRVPLVDAIGKTFADKIHAKTDGIVNCETLGGFVDFMKKHRLTDLNGIGQGVASKIEDAMMDFWKAHPQFCPDLAKGKPAGPPRNPRTKGK